MESNSDNTTLEDKDFDLLISESGKSIPLASIKKKSPPSISVPLQETDHVSAGIKKALNSLRLSLAGHERALEEKKKEITRIRKKIKTLESALLE